MSDLLLTLVLLAVGLVCFWVFFRATDFFENI
jgi:hypothetical protein